MKTKKIIFLILVVIFFFYGCPKDTIEPDQPVPLASGPEIEWISGGTTMTYRYMSGFLIGYNFHRSFIVSKESGEISIDIQILNNDTTKVSGTFNVEKDMQYALEVKGTMTGRKDSSPGVECLTVVFSSPNSLTTYEIMVPSFLTMSGGFDFYYCPKSLIFGEIVSL